MEEEFVPYEIAIKVREKGFLNDCFGFYYYDGSNKRYQVVYKESSEDYAITINAPLWQQVTMWLDGKEIFCNADMRIEDGLFKWYPVIKTVRDYEQVTLELKPRGKKIDALTDVIEYALTLI